MICSCCGKKHRTKRGAKNCFTKMRISCDIQCFPNYKNKQIYKEYQDWFEYYNNLKD